MNKTLPDELIKNKLYELRELLSTLLIDNSLKSEKVLETSRKLDNLILKFYSNTQEK